MQAKRRKRLFIMSVLQAVIHEVRRVALFDWCGEKPIARPIWTEEGQVPQNQGSNWLCARQFVCWATIGVIQVIYSGIT
jgi:hypothetical protein